MRNKPGRSLAEDCALLLQTAAVSGRQGNVLLIQHAGVEWMDAPCLIRDQHSFGFALHLRTGVEQERESRVICRTEELPFEDGSFKRVVLLHAIENGSEPELTEACRVLSSAGELLVLGLNPWGLRSHVDKKVKKLPKLRSRSVVHQLHSIGMLASTQMGAGFFSLPGVTVVQGGWGRILLPIADLMLIRAEHEDKLPSQLLKIETFRAGVASTAG